MFGINRSRNKNIRTADIKNIFGYILQNRSDIINYGDVASKNIYVTPIIGQAHIQNQKKLSDEFDALALYLAADAYMHFGVERVRIFDALDELLQEFLEDGAFSTPAEKLAHSKRFHQTLNEYLDAQKSAKVAGILLDKLATAPSSRFDEEAVNVLGRQLDIHRKKMLAYIKQEISS